MNIKRWHGSYRRVSYKVTGSYRCLVSPLDHGVGLARLLLGGDLDPTLLLLEKLESLSKLPERLRLLGGDLEAFLVAGIGLRETRRCRGGDRDRDGEGDCLRGAGGARSRGAPVGGETDLILVTTGVRDRARWSGRRGGGDLESE